MFPNFGYVRILNQNDKRAKVRHSMYCLMKHCVIYFFFLMDQRMSETFRFVFCYALISGQHPGVYIYHKWFSNGPSPFFVFLMTSMNLIMSIHILDIYMFSRIDPFYHGLRALFLPSVASGFSCIFTVFWGELACSFSSV